MPLKLATARQTLMTCRFLVSSHRSSPSGRTMEASPVRARFRKGCDIVSFRAKENAITENSIPRSPIPVAEVAGTFPHERQRLFAHS